jgi:hypothetical protein
MIFQLRAGVDGIAEEADKVMITLLASALNDIRWDRHCRANHLISERSIA